MSSVHFKRHMICAIQNGGSTDLNQFLEAHLRSRTQSDQSKALLKISSTQFVRIELAIEIVWYNRKNYFRNLFAYLVIFK